MNFKRDPYNGQRLLPLGLWLLGYFLTLPTIAGCIGFCYFFGADGYAL